MLTVLWRRSSQSIVNGRLLHTSKIRYARKHYSRTKEDVIAYSKFKKEMNENRSIFQKELRAQREMNMAEFNTQAAEEARLEKEAEEMVLESNQIELERMSHKRFLLEVYRQ